ncbi:MAG: hypothetical protein KC978_10015 [Candidatus Omnitrophica bacterium]|nr:hypothetical protein [Candidatus Omnitrophota bacterium]
MSDKLRLLITGGVIAVVLVFAWFSYSVFTTGFGQGVSPSNRSYWFKSDVLYELRLLLTEMHRCANSEDGEGYEMRSPFETEEFRFGEFSDVYKDWFSHPIMESYEDSSPRDRYSEDDSDYFVASKGSLVAIISVGRDGQVDVTRKNLGMALRDEARVEKEIENFQYSTTNGIDSQGDLLFPIATP